MPDNADRLTSQLTHLPAIIRDLGLAVAEAQTEFNRDYVMRLTQILTLFQRSLGDALKDKSEEGVAKAATLRAILEQFVPPRYQFTETTLDFSADLAETFDTAVTVGVGFGTPAVKVNASLTLGYGYDYRAAARITTVLHASPPTKDFAEKLLGRAGSIFDKGGDLPARSDVEKKYFDELANMHKVITKKELPKPAPATEPATPTTDPATPAEGE